jgi:hypothetical protein
LGGNLDPSYKKTEFCCITTNSILNIEKNVLYKVDSIGCCRGHSQTNSCNFSTLGFSSTTMLGSHEKESVGSSSKEDTKSSEMQEQVISIDTSGLLRDTLGR